MTQKPHFRYPIFLDLKRRSIVVIGGGAVAERKIASLLKAGAGVTVVSPFLTSVLTQRFQDHEIKVIPRNYQQGDLEHAALAFAATDDPEVNRTVAKEGAQKGIWVNVADQSVPGDFIVPASFSEKGVTISISSGGGNPALSVKIRDKIKQCLAENILEER